MRIKDRPEYGSKPKPLTCAPNAPVLEAVQRMAEFNYGSIIVVDENDKVMGLVTERDLFRRLIAPQRDPATTTVREIMTTSVRVARDDDDLLGWLRIMSNERFRRLPVVDADGKLVSIMTQGDFVSYTWPELLGQAATLARSTLASGYPILNIVLAVLAYSLILVFILLSVVR